MNDMWLVKNCRVIAAVAVAVAVAVVVVVVVVAVVADDDVDDVLSLLVLIL